MEDDTINLIDCIRVIRKRKILIIVGTLICTVAATVISLRLPETYRAESVINIGQKVDKVITWPLQYSMIDSPANVKKSISAIYDRNEEFLGYYLRLKVPDVATMVGVSVEGADMRRAKEILEEVINRLCDDHYRIRQESLQFHKNRINKESKSLKPGIEDLKADIKMIQGDKSYVEKQMEEMQAEKANPVAMATFMDIRWARHKQLRNEKQELFKAVSAFESCENAEKEITVLESLEKYKTRVIGGIRVEKASVSAKKKLFVPAGGAVGFTISLFLVLFIECVRERGEGKKNSV
jgi:hypothetical protein